MRSYVVKRREHLRHSRRRRMVSPARPSRESITLSSRCAQKGHFTRWVLLGARSILQELEIRNQVSTAGSHTKETSLRELRFPPQFLRLPAGAGALARPTTSLRGITAALRPVSKPQRSPARGSSPRLQPALVPPHTAR